jgi:hypothetical protein
MKFFVVPILIVVIMTQTFSSLFVNLAFRANQGYIAKNVCVNRYVPEMHCKGKCVLMKKIKENQDSEQSQPDVKTEINLILISSRSFYSDSIPSRAVTHISRIVDDRFEKPVDISLSFFQPPRA